jgi:Flp pilus assembly protein TadD
MKRKPDTKAPHGAAPRLPETAPAGSLAAKGGKALLLTASYQLFSVFLLSPFGESAHAAPGIGGAETPGLSKLPDGVAVAAAGEPLASVRLACIGCTSGPDNVAGECAARIGGCGGCTGCTSCTRCTECTRCTGCTGCTGCISLTTNEEIAVHHYNIGLGLQEARNWSGAEEQFRTAIRRNPGWWGYHFRLAYVLAQAGRHQEAIDEYLEVIRLNPAEANAYNNIGVAYENMHRRADAEAWYRKALKVDRNVEKTPENLSGVVDEGRKEVMENCFQAAWKLDEEGRPAAAEALWRKYLLLNPESASAWNNLGVSLERQGRQLEAEAAYRSALKLEPGDETYRENVRKRVESPERKGALAQAMAAASQGKGAAGLAEAFREAAAKGQSLVCFDDARGCSHAGDHSVEAVVFAPAGKEASKPVPEAVKRDPGYVRLKQEMDRGEKEYKASFDALQTLWSKRDASPPKEKGTLDVKIAEVRSRLTEIKSEQRIREIEVGKVYKYLGFEEP